MIVNNETKETTMKLRIEQDTDAQSPSEYGDTGLYLVAEHRDFYVPAPGKKRAQVRDEIDSRADTHWVFLVEAYIHSGVVLALVNEGNFPDRQWDVSILGAVFASKGEWPDMGRAREAALSKVDEWNHYLSGDVWGCIVEDDDGHHLDSCWGFYGRDYAQGEGQSMLEYCQKHALAEANAI